MSIPIRGLFPTKSSYDKEMQRRTALEVHVSFPAIVNVVNDNGTVDVQPAIRERVIDDNNILSFMQLPIIPNVPVVFPCAGGCSITMPVSPGDECLVVITDQSFDNWWLYGGIQNPIEQRRHDLTDAFAIFGIRSLPKGSSISSSLDMNGPGGNKVSISSDSISISCGYTIMNVTSSGVEITGDLIVDGININNHVHKANGATADTGGPKNG